MDRFTGENDLQQAQIASVTYMIDRDRLEEFGCDDYWLDEYEKLVE